MIILHVAILVGAIGWAAWWLLREQVRYWRNAGRIPTGVADRRTRRLKDRW